MTLKGTAEEDRQEVDTNGNTVLALAVLKDCVLENKV